MVVLCTQAERDSKSSSDLSRFGGKMWWHWSFKMIVSERLASIVFTVLVFMKVTYEKIRVVGNIIRGIDESPHFIVRSCLYFLRRCLIFSVNQIETFLRTTRRPRNLTNVLYSIQHCVICRPQSPLCRRMLASNPGLWRLRHWQSNNLTTRLDLINQNCACAWCNAQ